MAAIWLITGGVRSGKSRLALRLALEAGGPGETGTYVATAEAGDAEMAARIAAHRSERPAGWRTIEEPLELAAALRGTGPGPLIVDCLTLWVSNRMGVEWAGAEPQPGQMESMAEALAAEAAGVVEALAAREGVGIVVTNEVGWGVIAERASVRGYGELLGRVNALLAEAAQRVYLCVAGQALELKGAGAESVGE